MIYNKNTKKEALITSAENLFEKYGYRKVSIDEIVAKAGVAKGTFYLYFKNKDDIYTQILESYYQNEVAESIKKYVKKEKDTRTKLYEDFVYGADYLQKRKILKEVLLKNPHYFSESIGYDFLIQKNIGLIELLFSEYKKELRDDVDIKTLASIYAMLAPVFFQNKDKKKFQQGVENFAKIFIDGILSKHSWQVDSAEVIIKKIEIL